MALHRIDWTAEARSDIRALDRSTATRIFEGLYRYALTGEGDLKARQGKHVGTLRLPLGDCRVFFPPEGEILRILGREEPRGRLPLVGRGLHFAGPIVGKALNDADRFDADADDLSD